MNFSLTRIHAYRPFLPLSVPPIFPAVLSFIAGILAAYYHQYWLIPLVVSIPALVTISKNNIVRKKPFFYALFFIAGFLRTDLFLHYRLALLPLWHTSVEATVDSIGFVEGPVWRYQTVLSVSRFFDTTSWKKKSFTLQLYTSKKPNFKVDDTIHCALDHIPAPQGEFQLYLYKEDIDATAFQPVVISKIIKRPSYSCKRWISQKKRILHYCLLKKMSKPTFALFSSLFMGNRSAVKQELEPQKPCFKTWGISHFLARSGLHLLIFIALISRLLQYIPLPFLIKHALMLFIALIYFLFSWTTVSFNRAFYTFIFYKASTFAAIPFHSMHALAFVCLITLIKSPLQLFFLDFQLTFLLTFCLIWIAHTHHQRRLSYPQSIAEIKKKNLL